MIAPLLAPLPLLLAFGGATDQPTPRDLLGEGTPLVASLDDAAGMLDVILDSRLFAAARATPEWQAWWKASGTREAWSGARLFADLMRSSPQAAFSDALGLHVDIGVRPRADGEPALLLWTRTRSPDIAARLAQVITHLATLGGGDADAFDDAGDVRSANGQEFHCVIEDAFLISNDEAWLEGVVARARQGLASGPRDATRGIQLEIDLQQLRGAFGLDPLPQRYDNALVPLLMHGLFAALNQAPHASIRVLLDDDGLRVEAAIPAPPQAAGDAANDWFFSPPGGSLPPLPPGTLGWYRLTRDFAEFYDRRAELLDPELEGGWIEFDNVMSIFFSGRSFGPEVLAALGEEAQLLVSEQSYGDLAAPPQARIPAFALITPVDGTKLRKNDLIIAFQTAMGIINADRAQNGLDPLMIGTERHAGVDVSCARYLEWEGEGAPPMQYNFSPSIAICEGRLILGSARDQVLAIVDALKDPSQPPAAVANSELMLRMPTIVSTLRANRRPLVADRMLKEGETSAQAGLFFDRLEGVLGLLEDGTARLEQRQDGLHLSVELHPTRSIAREQGR